MSLRGPVKTLTARREAPSLMGRVDGWTGWTGGRVDGWDGPEKGPLNFFILCGYIDYVYVYLHVYEIKIVTNILMGFKVSCQVEGRV